MELNNYLMTRAMEALNKKYNKLGKKKTFNEPTQEKRSEMKIFDSLQMGLCIGGLIGGIIGLIVGIHARAGFLNIIKDILLYFVIGTVVVAILFIVKEIIRVKWDADKKKQEYEKAMKEYNKNLSNDANRVKTEKKQKDVVAKEYNLLKAKLEESKAQLQKFYNRAGIDATYRNIYPIGYMNELARLGVSNKLDGADGLYYLVRQELRYDSFNYQLQEISNKLDVIIDQNKAIYSELREINVKCDRMIDLSLQQMKQTDQLGKSIDEIAQSSSIAAYNSNRCSKELEYARYFGYPVN